MLQEKLPLLVAEQVDVPQVPDLPLNPPEEKTAA